MQFRKLGRSVLEVPVVSFGAWAIGGWNWGGTDDDAAVEAIHTAIDAGVIAIDTAPIYGMGHSERVVGRALAGRRERALVMTKVGLRWDSQEGELGFQFHDESGKMRSVYRNSRPDSIRKEVDDSLRRLDIETIDLIQIHWPDPTTPIADSIGALCELRRAGKVREIGVSNFNPDQMSEARRALGDVPLASNQPKYNLLAREIEADVLPYAREHDIGLIVYSPIEQGLLTGKVGPERVFPASDGRHRRPTFQPKNRARVNAVLDGVVRPIAEAHGATLSQVVIAWTVAVPGVTSAIVGARSPNQVLENAAAGDLKLSPDDLTNIRRTFEALELESPSKARGLLRRAIQRLLRS